MSWTASLPPTRVTGGTGEPAVDVNTLTAALTETRDRIEDADLAAQEAGSLATSAHEEAEDALAAVGSKIDTVAAMNTFLEVKGGSGMVLWPPSVDEPDEELVEDGQLWLRLP